MTETPTPTPAQVRSWRSFLEAHAAVGRAIDAELSRAALPPLGWYDVLWALREAPGRRLRMHELAERVLLSRTGLTRLVDRIETAGCLRREPVPGDRRGTYVSLTAAGTRLLGRMWPVYARCIGRWFTEPVGAEHVRLRAALERVTASTGDQESSSVPAAASRLTRPAP
jgi:DNA-binding MarR family transcriptional regulator